MIPKPSPLQIKLTIFAEIFWTVIERSTILSLTMWNIMLSEGLEQQKLALNV